MFQMWVKKEVSEDRVVPDVIRLDADTAGEYCALIQRRTVSVIRDVDSQIETMSFDKLCQVCDNIVLLCGLQAKITSMLWLDVKELEFVEAIAEEEEMGQDKAQILCEEMKKKGDELGWGKKKK